MKVKEDLLKCTKCEQKCKREGTLNKHKQTTHEEHACKESSKKLSSLIELLKHIASKYFKESDEESEMKVQSEVVESENEN